MIVGRRGFAWHTPVEDVEFMRENNVGFFRRVMVALNEKLHHKDTTTRSSGRRNAEFGCHDKSVGAAASVVNANHQRSMITDQNFGISAGLFIDPCSLIFERSGGLTGNIPNETIDYLWQGWQTVEERDPFGGTGSTDTPVRQYIWGTYIDECIQLTTYTILGSQLPPAGAYYLLQDLLFRAEAILAAILAAYLLHLARQAAKEKCENEKPKCNPCIPPVGTVGYLWHIVPPAKPHWPFPGDHLNLFDMQQSPSPICKCF